MKYANNWRFKANTLALSVAAAMLVATGAQAQERLEEIQITGTRIRTTDGMVTPTPVTAVTTAEMRDFDPSSSVSEQLDNLPQFLNTQTAQRGGGTLFGDAAGSYLNLRNMGKQRTLVLFDGSRVVPADRASTVNVDNFPTALIRTVDVVTGGASAAYGADALAGVVNFVLDREFEGFKSTIGTGVTEQGDGQNWNFSVAGGKQIGDRLHVIGSIEHRDIKQIERTPQDLENWNSIGWVVNPAWKSTDPAGTNPQRLTMPNVHSATQNAAGLITAKLANGSLNPAFRLNNYTFTDDGKNMRPFVTGNFTDRLNADGRAAAGSNGMQSGGPEAFNAENSFAGGPYGAEVVQHSGFGGFKFDVSNTTELFGQVMLGRTESNQLNRRGNPEMGQQYFGTVYLENAFIPAQLRQAMVDANLTSVNIAKIGQIRGAGKRNVDDRGSSDISQMWSASVGFDQALPNDWNLHGTYQYGESKLTSEGNDYIRNDHWYMAMDAVRDPKTGAVMCNVQLRNPSMAELQAAAVGKTVPSANIIKYPSGVQPIDNILVTPQESIRDCVPLNVFGTGNFSAEAVDYITSDKKGIRDLQQHFAEALLTGEIYEGWGAGPIGFAGGLTYREEWFNQLTTPVAFERSTINAPEVGIRGISVGINGGNRSIHNFSATSWATGEFDVWEWFTELNVPIWESGSGNQRLTSTLAFRQSDYSHSGKIDSWKAGFELQVIQDLRLRVTQSLDVREPTFGEQFESGGGGANITDPVDKTSYTITLLTGGNANLSPEEADTLTAGVVWAPSFSLLEGFQVSADWYEIDVSGRVNTLGSQRVVNDCFAGDLSLCGLITRNAITGKIERVLDINQNVAGGLTSGIDIEARYTVEPNFFSSESESLDLRLFATKGLENSITTTVYRDDIGNQNSPEWTATATLGYNLGNYGVSLVERYYDSVNYSSGGLQWRSGYELDDATIASQAVTNLVLRYNGETASGATWSTSFNVNNLFDRNPPIIATESQRGGQQSVGNSYDVFGRRYQLSLNYNF